MSQAEPTTIVESLTEQARLRSHRAAFTVADAPRGEQHTVSYGELLSTALEVATGLRELGLRRGDRVLVCLPTGLDNVVSLYGVLVAGGVCVPVYPPSSSHRIERWKKQVAAVARVSQPVGALVSRSAVLHMRSVLANQGEGLFVSTRPAVQRRGRGPDSAVDVQPSDLALVQFTSGTTAWPRGAAITHESLMANIDALVAGMQLGEDDISVSWLPPYHDMGLTGHIFTPLRGAVHQVLLSPRTFAKDPASWLRQIAEVRATQTTAPNAAYEMCVSRTGAADRVGLDLSSLRWALNGAELVHAGTIERFCRAFERWGLSRRVIRPVYGLAEATLAATLGPEGGPRVDWIDRRAFARDRTARPLSPDAQDAIGSLSVGEPIPHHEVRIVNGDGGPLGEREVGEVCFRGPSVMREYFNDPRATAEVFGRDGWLHTGDLGYLDDDGALHITGRDKDLVIKNGRNYLPQDFESAASAVDGVRAGRVVACGVPNERMGTEAIVVFAEVRAPRSVDSSSIRRQVSDAVADATGQRPDEIVLLPPGTLPKTTSGKLQRSVVREAYEAGTPLPGSGRPLSTALVPSLRSLAGIVEARVTRLLGWQ